MPQATYSINCHACGRLFEVANPRPHQEPSRILRTGHEGMFNEETVSICCPHCSKGIWVVFTYAEKPCTGGRNVR